MSRFFLTFSPRGFHSQCRRDLMQALHFGNVSSHFTRRVLASNLISGLQSFCSNTYLHVKHPFRDFGADTRGAFDLGLVGELLVMILNYAKIADNEVQE